MQQQKRGRIYCISLFAYFFMLRSFPHPLSHSLKAERASLTQDFVTLHAIANSTGIFVECFISKRYITTM